MAEHSRSLAGVDKNRVLPRHPRPSEAIIDFHCVKSAAMVSQAVGFDNGKLIKGRKRFLSVDTLGLVLRVLVTAANVGERSGGQTTPQTGQTYGQRDVTVDDNLGRWGQ